MVTKNNRFEWMGVVNATPNSFSDGGELLDPVALKQRLGLWQKVGARFLDLGAESTAPMNAAVGHDEEWRRIESVIEHFNNLPISLDSFRIETVSKFLARYPLAMWNDISGQLDDALASILQQHPELQTVFCHNRAPSRELSGKHMDYVSEEAIFKQLEDDFSRALKWYEAHNHRAPFLDFCFGFSKTHEQNWQILKELPAFIHGFERKYGAQQWILAVSRKSFFKRLALEGVDHEVRGQTEYMHSYYLAWLERELDPAVKILVRLHDPFLAHAVSTMEGEL